ncbi:hypothetical protein HK103_001738 [Boothiomyces macroporosus]|uniref:CRAL-TRIO domain-containing protein n=1 Tax=Boothiomyces macroporosus TaxID=261099 RepID=A0AAD5Y5D1_9FUNG|nr:hypothetical protein HK103_001738 [Boothiomyces macroporosus]
MSNKIELEIDSDDVLTGADEVERQRQINMFVVTARELYKEDGVDALTDIEVSKWLLGNGGHKDKLTIIFDKSGMRADKEDVKLASYIVPILQKHYPERLSRIPVALYEWISRENYFKRFGGMANDPFEDPESAKQVEKDSAPTQKVLKTNAVADVKVVEELWSAPLEYQDV